jgi:uncharacterized protein YndB with AHSA1/START domain
MIWVLVAVGVVAGLIVAIVLIGLLLPKGHTASRTATFARPPEVVWDVIADFRAAPTWRKELARVEVLADANGQPVWKEVPKRGTPLTLQRIECDPPRRLVGKIADPKLPFGGCWVYELKPVPSGCTLTITENGEIYNPVFRFVSQFFNLAATIELYLKQLGEHLDRGAPARW